MNVLVKNIDNSETNYAFDPARAAAVVGEYALYFFQSRIRGYQVTFDDGTGFGIGCYSQEAI